MEAESNLSKEEVVSKIFELYEECKKFPEWNIISVGDIFLSQQLREVVNKGIF